LIAEGDIPAVTADNGLRCRQAETDTPRGAIARPVDPEEGGKDPSQVQALLEEKIRLKRALMDPGLAGETLAEEGPAAQSA